MRCTRCGMENPAQAIACGRCGQALTAVPPLPYAPQQPAGGSGQATAALILGIISLFAWCIPLVGLPTSVVGLVLGVKALNGPARGMAIAGVATSSIGLLLSVANAVLGAYLGATGRHPLVNRLRS